MTDEKETEKESNFLDALILCTLMLGVLLVFNFILNSIGYYFDFSCFISNGHFHNQTQHYEWLKNQVYFQNMTC